MGVGIDAQGVLDRVEKGLARRVAGITTSATNTPCVSS
jgi:hypothetical protein